MNIVRGHLLPTAKRQKKNIKRRKKITQKLQTCTVVVHIPLQCPCDVSSPSAQLVKRGQTFKKKKKSGRKKKLEKKVDLSFKSDLPCHLDLQSRSATGQG